MYSASYLYHSSSISYHYHHQYLYNGDEALEHPRPNFYVDLRGTTGLAHGPTTKPFVWHQYLNSSPWGRALLTENVRYFALCWLTDRNRPGFHVTRLDGQMLNIDPSANVPLRFASECVALK